MFGHILAQIPLDVENVTIGGVAGLCLGFVIWFAKTLHNDAKQDRAEHQKALLTVVDRNTDAHIRAAIIMERVEKHLNNRDGVVS